jgi:hypothetical protein
LASNAFGEARAGDNDSQGGKMTQKVTMRQYRALCVLEDARWHLYRNERCDFDAVRVLWEAEARILRGAK